MVGLVIDGGYAWGRQRATQNGADSIAKAGAVVILEWLDEKPQTIGDVGCAVELAETENNVDIERAEFTDHTGALIGVDVPLCGTAGAIPPTAQGIRAEAAQTFDTFLMSVVGFNELTARANATAIVGPITGSGVGLPVTFPQTMELCDDSGDVQTIRDWDEADCDGTGANDGVWTPFEILPQGATLNSVEPVDHSALHDRAGFGRLAGLRLWEPRRPDRGSVRHLRVDPGLGRDPHR